jgi:FHA domain-containing protein
MVGRIHTTRGHRLTQISWYRRSDPEGARKQSRIFPAGTTVTIGRGPDHAIILDDDAVSRNHARLEIADGKVLFEDLGSTNGSLLNGTQPIRRMDWGPGQRIRVGNYVLEVAFGVDETSDATIVGPIRRRPLGHVAGTPGSRLDRQGVPTEVNPATRARLDALLADNAGRPVDRKGNGEPSVVDEGRDATSPLDAGAAPEEDATQTPLQHPLKIALGVREIASNGTPSAAETDQVSISISDPQTHTLPPLEITGTDSIIDAKSDGSPPTRITEATPDRVSAPEAQDTPWLEIAGSAGQSIDETQNGTSAVQESVLLWSPSPAAIVSPFPDMVHDAGQTIDTTGEGRLPHTNAISTLPRAPAPKLQSTLSEHKAKISDQYTYDVFISPSAAEAAIGGDDTQHDWELRPETHADALPREARALKHILCSPETTRIMERYSEHDREAVRQQARYRRARSSLVKLAYLTALTGVFALSVHLILTYVPDFQPLLVVVHVALLSGLVIMAARLNRADPRTKWLAARGQAEQLRVALFDRVLAAEEPVEAAELPLLPLKLAYFRRYQLDVQLCFFQGRGRQLARLAGLSPWLTLPTMAIAIAILGIALAFFAHIADEYGFPVPDAALLAMRMESSERIASWTFPLLAISTVYAFFLSQSSVSEDARAGARYLVLYDNLRFLKDAAYEEVRKKAEAGDKTPVARFVGLVHDLMIAEQSQWISFQGLVDHKDALLAGRSATGLAELLADRFVAASNTREQNKQTP